MILLLLSATIPTLGRPTINEQIDQISWKAPTHLPTPTNPFIRTFQISRNSSDYAPYLITTLTNKTVFVVAFTQRNAKPPLSQIFNYTIGVGPKPILSQPFNGTVPTDIVYDQILHRVWFLVDQNLTYFDPSTNSTITEHTFTGDSPYYMAIDPFERIWITLVSSNRVAEYSPFTRQVSFYNAPTPNAGLQGIAVSPDGSVWFAEPIGKKIGHLVCQPTLSTTCSMSEFAPPPEIHIAYIIQVAVDLNGTVWFTDHGVGEFGSFNPSTNQWRLFPIGYCLESYNPDCAVGLPNAISRDSNGHIWFSEHYAGRVAEYDPKTQILTEYIVPATTPPYVWWMQPGPENLVWFAAFGTGQIGYVNASLPVPIRIMNATSIVELRQGQTATIDASTFTPQSTVYLNVTANGNDSPFGTAPMLYGLPNTSPVSPGPTSVTTTFRLTAAWNLSPGDRYITLAAYNSSVEVSTFVRVRIIAQLYLFQTSAPVLGLGLVTSLLAGTGLLFLRDRLSRRKENPEK